MLIEAHLERVFLHWAARSINQYSIGSICSNHVDGRAEMTSSDRERLQDRLERGVTVPASWIGPVCVWANASHQHSSSEASSPQVSEYLGMNQLVKAGEIIPRVIQRLQLKINDQGDFLCFEYIWWLKYLKYLKAIAVYRCYVALC